MNRHNFLLTTVWIGAGFLILTGMTRCDERVATTMPIDEQSTPLEDQPVPHTTLQGEFLSPAVFGNPYSHIPAQCYVETSGGTQNACLFCHTNGPARAALGNNNPQAGMEPLLGNLQLEYSFVQTSPFTPPGSINPWENTLFPERVRAAVTARGIVPEEWDMAAYIREDNWSAGYRKRAGDAKVWDSGIDGPFRLFPGLNPDDLPADEDGFVRTTVPARAFLADGTGRITGWRAVNFMPYGIFTPMTGSVSGIYLRLPERFMRNREGVFDLAVYQDNLDLLERAIQDRLRDDDLDHYHGMAADTVVQRGLYPLGTEFAHPLHYVDTAADGSSPFSPFPGLRSRRVKEIRFMYKREPYDPRYLLPGDKEEDAPIYVNPQQGWIDNGAGWILAAFIEDEQGELRPQTPEELMQCLGCHSGTGAYDPPLFTSGTGNTIDSTWSFPRKFAGAAGWREMDYLGYRATPGVDDDQTPGTAQQGDPLNRHAGKGEFRLFLDHVVGGNLYGVMPAAMERFLAEVITPANGYTAAWPYLDTTSPEALLESQRLRQQLLREMTRRGDYLDSAGNIQPALLYPPCRDALSAASRYRQVVVTQRYNRGKDVFPETPFTFRYYRTPDSAYTHLDGRSYRLGEVITDRSIDTGNSITAGVGITPTGIDQLLEFDAGGTYFPEYMPLLSAPDPE